MSSSEYINASEVSKEEETDHRYISFIGYIERTEDGYGKAEKTLLYDFESDEIVYAVRTREERAYKVVERKEVTR